jgi:Subtilase family/Secretion system C-terminal sorting domain
MKFIKTFLFCLIPVIGFSQASLFNPLVNMPTHAYSVVANPGAHVPDQLLIQLYPGVNADAVQNEFETNGFPVISKVNTSRTLAVWTFTFAAGTNLELAIKTTQRFTPVRFAQYNHYVARRNTVPNDSLFSAMWSLDNTGQNGGTPDADIDAPEAWDLANSGITSTGDTLVVAVIDGGFSLAHADLHFWKNYAEIPGNGLDDDNNGYIDDYNGWNSYNSTGNITSDLHGTHVAGTVGARGNNSIGVTGVCWGVQIMPVMGSDGTEANAVESYTYVLDQRKRYNATNGAQGAFVVATNASFGVDLGQPANYPIWCAIYDSLGAAGILNAGATANQNWDIDDVGDMPTACSSNYLISVTNSTRLDLLYTYAGYGATTIDLAAPGTQINSTTPGNGYGILTGTSMSTPHVAGTIALMYAVACPQLINNYKANPDSISLLMRNYLLMGTDPIPAMNGICTSNGRLNLYGALNAVLVYGCLSSIDETNQTQPVLQNVFPNPATELVTVSLFSEEEKTLQVQICDLQGRIIETKSVSVNGNQFVQMDISQLSSGMYLIQVLTEGQILSAQRLVVK